jgi:hypothetical protein
MKKMVGSGTIVAALSLYGLFIFGSILVLSYRRKSCSVCELS